MWVADYQWHYDYVRLAWDTGFSFEKCKSPNLDKNKICVIDVDRIVKERDVATVDRYIATVVQYILEDEQAKVLDNNFVKIFRISQLAVEYLLFCKKYLDNTVILLKKELTNNREENKGLKAIIDDLQAQIEALTRQQLFAAFKCSLCSKVFASEEYLNAHIKRRHNSEGIEISNSETEKLNMEIKELKERLNNTEKLLKEKNEQSPEKYLSDVYNENSKVVEVLEKFEKFKNQVDVELKELKIQKSFYEDNYGKLFNIVIQNKENVEPKNQNQDILKTETTTQTDKLLQMENVNFKNVLEIQESVSSNSSENRLEEKNKETLEDRISTTLAGIEGQMQSFWNKLNEIEKTKSSANLEPVLAEKVVESKNEFRPRAKPRSKLSQPTHITKPISTDTEKIRKAIEEMEYPNYKENDEILVIHETSKQNSPIIVASKKPAEPLKDHTNEEKNCYIQSDLESESFESSESDQSKSDESVVDPKLVPKLLKSEPKLGSKHVVRPKRNINIPEQREAPVIDAPISPEKHSYKSAKKSPARNSRSTINKEIEDIVCNRLQELGISETWTRLPAKSFEKAFEIINHQATLTKKAYPNFNSVKKKLVVQVEKECIQANSQKQQNVNSNAPKLKKVQNIVKVSYRPKSGRNSVQKNSVPSPKTEAIKIKNRELYDTDTESEKSFHGVGKTTAPNAVDSHQWYSNVIGELRSRSNVKSPTDDDGMDEMNKDTQKGLLKSFPSVGSLSKKKVLFDLDSDSSKIQEPPVVQKTGGSTTSIASSILGDKVHTVEVNENNKELLGIKNMEKDLDNLSDFDISDL